jgi:acetyltransferase-like isoleucine patch superfamily enzyme
MLKRAFNAMKRTGFVQGNVTLGEGFHMGLGSFVTSMDHLEIGRNVYVGKYCSIECSGRIGNEVLIANNVGVVGRRDHDTKQLGVPVRSARQVRDSAELAKHPANRIEIGDDVWIGFGAIVLTGITIGRGAIVAAGAVVFDNVPEYAIVRGNPAVVVGSRFDAEQALRHEALMKDRA